ncbi:hypothetical protein [Allorhodopirellula heiligendammensis]|uniref:Uncharacterized protein n=1 Tax=Allorhodopirellula heiligendammensis TaxID=2714739 RepID=A0A5C6C2V6_9BACT|nr:hypothetical protein [Allorhodopirellula heiligendammensis]TWU17991.1 hypothetical protein Poly21_01440 [Allorhodopirellula heiligendammensis]
MSHTTPAELAHVVAALLANKIEASPIPSALVSREFLPVYTPAKLTTCRVPVAPVQTSSLTASRSAANRERSIQICPHLKTTPKGDTFDELQIEQFLDFVRWIDETLESHGRIGGHTRESSQILPLYDVEALNKDHVLKSVLTVTYRTIVRL